MGDKAIANVRRAMSENANKIDKYKKTISSIVDTFVCPITMEYVFRPVIAEDGRVYEENALRKWMEKDESPTFKSPATGVDIGKSIVYSLQIRQCIEHAINSGAIEAKKASAWKRTLKAEKQFGTIKKCAENGQVNAMTTLGFTYRDGRRGQPVNVTESIKWFEMAADENDPEALTALGVLHINGKGVAKDIPKGMDLLLKSAGTTNASEHACAILGECYARGMYGMRKDMDVAKQYYGKMKKCRNRDSISLYRKRAMDICKDSNSESKKHN
tara:strand:- start:6076 stop:6891 length:816 start_codon:yes stop_codon:yes gene_type:complete